MPRLLIIATVASTVQAFLTPFAAHFRALGWRVDGIASGLPGSPAADAFDRTWDATWSRNPLDPRNLTSAGPAIRRIVEEQGYDIVHVHTPVAALVTRWALRDRTTVKVVYTAHGFHFAAGLSPFRNAVFLRLERTAGPWTDALVVINAEDLEAAVRERIVQPERVRLIHGIGVDTGRYDRAAVPPAAIATARAALGVGETTPLLTMVAELNANKRHAFVLRALAGTAEPAHLALIGEGPLAERTRALAAGLGLADRVHMLGWVTDVRPTIAASLATVLFSEREGLPRSSMESLALEVPVIGSDIRGVRDLLDDDCGVLVPPGDVEALTRAIDALVADPERARRMGVTGREKMRGPYSLGGVLAEYEKLYAEVLGGQEGS